MNTMGKILVFINFLFALVIGGFMVIDFARRTNWKAAFDNADSQLRIARNNTDVLADANRKSLNEIARLTAELANHEGKTQARLSEKEKQIIAEKNARSQAEQASNKLLAQYNDLVAETKRRTEEVANLGKVIKQRDQTIVALEEDKSKLKAEAITAVNEKAATQERNMSLLAQVREQQKELARLSNSPGAIGKSEATRRPPLNYVKGSIDQVDNKGNLVHLNVGSDHGLAVDNTLEAYRLKPNPEYLGTLVILDVKSHEAVARLLPSEYRTRRVELRVGDEVASKLTR
jgi:hypothetical protein